MFPDDRACPEFGLIGKYYFVTIHFRHIYEELNIFMKAFTCTVGNGMRVTIDTKAIFFFLPNKIS